MANPAVFKIQYFNGKLEVFFFRGRMAAQTVFFMIKDQWNYTPAKTNIDTKKLRVWKRQLPLKIAILGIYVRFLECTPPIFLGEIQQFLI